MPTLTCRFIIVLGTSLLMSACVSPPKRVQYTAPDNVGAIDESILPGKWQQTMLNPLEGEETADVKFTFAADGTVKIISRSKTTEDFGVFEGIGTWEVSGDKILLDLVELNEISGNKLAAMAATFVRKMTNKTLGSANPYEMSQDRIVWLIEDSAQAVQLDRIN